MNLENSAPMLTILFSVAQPDQARIVALNAKLFLKQGGGMLISIKANCIDSTAPPEQVFAQEVEKLRQEKFFPKEQLTLEPYERDHAVSTTLHSLSLVTREIRQQHSCRAISLTTTFRWCRQFTGRRSLCLELMILELGNALFYCNLIFKGVLSVGWFFSLRFGTGERRRSWASSVRLFTCNATRVFYYVLRRYGRPRTSRYPVGSSGCSPVLLRARAPRLVAFQSCLALRLWLRHAKFGAQVLYMREAGVANGVQHQKKIHLSKLQSIAPSERKSPRERIMFQVSGHEDVL